MHEHLAKQDFLFIIYFSTSPHAPQKYMHSFCHLSYHLPNATRSKHNSNAPDNEPTICPSIFQSLFLGHTLQYCKIASVFSHLRVFAPKERDKHCAMTDFFRGTSYLYRQNLKAMYQWQSFN